MHALRKSRDERFASAEALARAARSALTAPAAFAQTEAYPPMTAAPPSPYAQTMTPNVWSTPNPYAPPHAPMIYRSPALAPIAQHAARSGNKVLVAGGGISTAGGVLAFVAAAIPGVVNSSEIGTAIAIGVVACVAGIAMIVGGRTR
jgi:hypothetical protein